MMDNIRRELEKYGLTPEEYEQILDECRKKVNHLSDDDWSDIVDRHGLQMHYDSLRKASQTIFGNAFVHEYINTFGDDEKYVKKLEELKNEIRKERMKLQTLNIERNRIDRAASRQELFYEQVASTIEALPLPEFKAINNTTNYTEYLCCLSDLHYGADFVSNNNVYSKEIFEDRLARLFGYLIDFVINHKVSKLHVACLGDCIQGMIHISDIKINDSAIVKSVVEVSRLIASFLNNLSTYVEVEYYHVPTSNHTQIRPLGTKASELADEDLEYVISNYIKDLCANNKRVKINLAKEGKQYIKANINNNSIVMMHGHQIKNMDNAIKDLSTLYDTDINYLVMGHYHNGKEIPVSESACLDCEVLVCPSFVGSDPYSDSIMKGTKASVKIYGFDELYGHTETYKCILN